MVRFVALSMIANLFVSCAWSCQQIKLFGEVEKKSRRGKRIISQKMFVAVPSVMSPNSSEFSRLSVKGPEVDEIIVNYSSKGIVIVKDESYSVVDSLIKKFNLMDFEKKIETHRPGDLYFIFKKENQVICEKRVKFIAGD